MAAALPRPPGAFLDPTTWCVPNRTPAPCLKRATTAPSHAPVCHPRLAREAVRGGSPLALARRRLALAWPPRPRPRPSTPRPSPLASPSPAPPRPDSCTRVASRARRATLAVERAPVVLACSCRRPRVSLDRSRAREDEAAHLTRRVAARVYRGILAPPRLALWPRASRLRPHRLQPRWLWWRLCDDYPRVLRPFCKCEQCRKR